MNTIRIADVVGGTYTNVDGYTLKCAIDRYVKNGMPVFLSFENATAISSSFFNSSFGALIDEYGIDKFKEYEKPINITKTQLDNMRKLIDKIAVYSN